MGTTPDYIDHIRRRKPGRAVFITDPDTLPSSTPAATTAEDELICPLREEDRVIAELQSFLDARHITPSGVACFDCESLAMAAAIAANWKLPFPSSRTVLLCRDKLVCKQRWYAYGVPCPKVMEIGGPEDLESLLAETESGIIVKPLSGSGSELVFRCNTPAEATDAYRIITAGLATRSGHRMYQPSAGRGRPPIIAEEFIHGEEYSCDVLIKSEQVKIIRTARKYFPEKGPVGTTRAYEIPAELPVTTDVSAFMAYISAAVKAVEMTDGLCMLDFIVRNGRPYFLEISPRPGGDCLPSLIEESCGFDMISAAIDHAEGLWLMIPPGNAWKRLLGVRLHAERPGRLKAIRPLLNGYENRIRSMVWLKQPGDLIRVPPEDYGSWLLGFVIFEPLNGQPVPHQIRDLQKRIEVDIQ